MHSFEPLISPKQAARAMGVSESSLKRWCDRGLIPSVRTAGGHRRLEVANVLKFAREHGQISINHELLGLPVPSPHAEMGLPRGAALFAAALLDGQEATARQIILDLVAARHGLSLIFDRVFAKAFEIIGDRWACDDAEIFQERRACEIASQILHELRRMQPTTTGHCLAIGGTTSDDHYSLPSLMAEITLREAGFAANALGVSIPMESFGQAVKSTRPQLFWLSVSHLSDERDFLNEFSQFSKLCAASGTAIIVGGRALTAELRQEMNYSAFCDTMQHLETFATTFLQATRTVSMETETLRKLPTQ